jgi:hypothetical protein
MEEIQELVEFHGYWDTGSRYNVLSGVRFVAGAMERTAGTAAALAYRRAIGPLKFVRKAPGTIDGWAWTHAYDGEIWVDAVGTRQYLQWGVLNTVHELGHAFAQLNPGTYEALGHAVIRNAYGKIIAGGSAGDNGRTLDGYAVSWGGHVYGGTTPWPVTQNPTLVGSEDGSVDPLNEDWADMFIGWTFELFADNSAGAARLHWMTTHLAEWIGG